MKRVLVTAFVLLALAGGVVAFASTSDQRAGDQYHVELDNAFGLTEGADVKVSGVRAGKVAKLSLDREDMRALVTIELNRGGFDDLRKDVRCETRPQSLIGEYFVDCNPGTASARLKPGDTIPVEQTETTVPLDLINDIMRRPYRERFTILLSELGAGLAARGEDLDETIRRAVPALRQVDRLLAILREQRVTIKNLYRDADRVFARVSQDRDEVARFVDEARDTASAAAHEETGIQAQWRTFPAFLRELRPTLAKLEETADAQIPALRNLNRAAPDMRALFRALQPYSDASRPAIRSLADAAQPGRAAMKALGEPVAELRRGVDDLPEASNNLAITLEHLDDPRFAVEKDARAGRGPNGGYTGLEALLRYFFAQSQATNLFDANSYTLKVSLFLDRQCANYTNAEDIKEGRSPDRCRAWLGRNQPGINSADFTKRGGNQQAASRRSAPEIDDSWIPEAIADALPEGLTGEDAKTPAAGSGAPTVPGSGLPALPSIPETPRVGTPDPGVRSPDTSGDLLDFLLGS